jgi:hypothetical protein
VRIIFDLPAGAMPFCDPCPLCAAAVRSWALDDVNPRRNDPEIIDRAFYLPYFPHLAATFWPCGHQLRAGQMQEWTEHRRIDALPFTVG